MPAFVIGHCKHYGEADALLYMPNPANGNPQGGVPVRVGLLGERQITIDAKCHEMLTRLGPNETVTFMIILGTRTFVISGSVASVCRKRRDSA